VSRIQQLLGYEPQVTFECGVHELVQWVGLQEQVRDDVALATGELAARGLMR
jgi:hypothetical protein